MATNMNEAFGWELLYKTVEKQIKSKVDLIVCVIHWVLIRRGFLCAGTDEEETVAVDEHLPNNWNSKCLYTLRYVNEGKFYVLKANEDKTKSYIYINFSCPEYKQISRMSTRTDGVKNISGNLNECLPNNQDIIEKINELIDKLLEPEKEHKEQAKESQIPSTSTQQSVPTTDSHFVFPTPPMFVLPGIRTDSRENSGMLMPSPGMGPRPNFNPILRDPHMPVGALPPGARFDPLHPFCEPPQPDPHSHPNHDHFKPPGPPGFS